MHIRIAGEPDIKSILSIINYEITHSTSIYDYEPRTLEMQMAWFEQKQSDKMPVIVAEEHEQVLGFATYGSFRPKIAYRFSVEHSIYVDHRKTGSGIGSLLMMHLIDLARTAGFHTMIAGVDASNRSSYEFHRKHGFTEVARFKEVGYKFDRWLDLIFMQLFLEGYIES